jgi:hypothetical protein
MSDPKLGQYLSCPQQAAAEARQRMIRRLLLSSMGTVASALDKNPLAYWPNLLEVLTAVISTAIAALMNYWTSRTQVRDGTLGFPGWRRMVRMQSALASASQAPLSVP